MDNLLQELQSYNIRYDLLKKQVQTLEHQYIEQQKVLQSLQENLLLQQESKEKYSQAIELLYSKSLGEVQDTINLGLSYIFYNKDYKISFELGDRVNKTLKVLFQEDNQEPVIMRDATGAGVRSIVSFVFLVYYLLAKKNYPVLFLDETYSEISSEYVERFFEFISKMCITKKLIIVMVTHDQRFISYADKVYNVSDGIITSEV